MNNEDYFNEKAGSDFGEAEPAALGINGERSRFKVIVACFDKNVRLLAAIAYTKGGALCSARVTWTR